MTFTETASAMRRVAAAIEQTVRESGDSQCSMIPPMFDGEMALGAALMLVYLRDLLTSANRDLFDRPSLLVLLQAISEDAEIFPCGTGTLVWDAEDPEEAA